jgi:hypothetical protein
MQTAVLLVVVAAVGGFIVVRTVFRDERATAKRRAHPDPVPEAEGIPDATLEGRPSGRGPRRLLTTAALTDALAVEGEEERWPSFFGRALAFGRLLLVILFICALAGGTLFWVAMMLASKAHIHPS